MIISCCFTVNHIDWINKKPRKQLFLGLVRLDQWEDYISIIPELAKRQARGIIMFDGSLRLSRLIQFGTFKLPYQYIALISFIIESIIYSCQIF
jgi:hypothetical protein